MLESLSDKLNSVFRNLAGRGALSEENMAAALRDIRLALLEADVALPVVKDFIAKVKEKSLGQEVAKSITPAQLIVKIVHDELVALLGEAAPLNLNAVPPVVILMAGLQGSGKTTTAAKLAKLLATKEKKKVLLASADVYRPAAQEQLAILAQQVGVESLPIVAGEAPLPIAARALAAARAAACDVLIFDTAGRVTLDDAMMAEIEALHGALHPAETLLVLDALTGQDALATATAFHAQLSLTGVVLTRMDGDARGGAALSCRAVTGCPIKFIGTGEKLDGLEVFYPDRLAGRILGMGDVVGLVETALDKIDQQEAAAMAAKMQSGKFDLNDLAQQLRQMQKIGGLGGIAGMLPGMGQMRDALKQMNADDKIVPRQLAIIGSMTKRERAQPEVIKASHRRRIAAGAGVKVEDVNRLLKQHVQMADMMKMLKGGGAKGLMKSLSGMLGGKTGGNAGVMNKMFGNSVSADDLARLQQLQSQIKSK